MLGDCKTQVDNCPECCSPFNAKVLNPHEMAAGQGTFVTPSFALKSSMPATDAWPTDNGS